MKIQIDKDYVVSRLKKLKISQDSFSKRLGYSTAWFGVRIRGKSFCVKADVADHMCDILECSINELCGLVPNWQEPEIDLATYEPPKQEEPKTDADLDRFIEILMRIDARLEDIEKRIEKLEWLSR